MTKNPIITIGFPVYNGEKFLQKRLESILSQTEKRFVITISDNASSDATEEICKKFLSKDDRIHYHRQEQNVGVVKNFKSVLENANTKYFVWASVDDIWLPTFLEENVLVLEKDERIIGSVSKIEPYGKKIEIKSPRLLKKTRHSSYELFPEDGSYEDQISFYLKLNSAENLYGIFRTEQLKESFVFDLIGLMDKAILLKILKYGKINMINKVLMYRYTQGFSRKESFGERLKQFYGYGYFGKIFPFMPFTYWFTKNFGIKLFFKNIDWFIYKNYGMQKKLLKYNVQLIKRRFSKK